MGTYPGYVNRVVEEARSAQSDVETEVSPRVPEAAD
jgi:hypothetical protein